MTEHPLVVREMPPGNESLQQPAEREVHVWLVDLAVSSDLVERLAALLGPDEQMRAERFRFERHRRRFIARRAALRVLLGHLTGVPARRLSFDYGPQGKPASREAPGLHFNVSHSADLATLAFARAGSVGIDIERLQAFEGADDLARRFFSAREVEAYFALEGNQRRRAFFDCWTRKEAFLKARGEGLSLALDSFDVSLVPGQPPKLLAVDGAAEAALGWRLRALDLGDEFAGTLATEWSPASAAAWRLPPATLGAACAL